MIKYSGVRRLPPTIKSKFITNLVDFLLQEVGIEKQLKLIPQDTSREKFTIIISSIGFIDPFIMLQFSVSVLKITSKDIGNLIVPDPYENLTKGMIHYFPINFISSSEKSRKRDTWSENILLNKKKSFYSFLALR